MDKLKISRQKEKEIEDKIRRYEYIRQNKVAFYQSLFTAVLAIAISLIIDLVSPTNLTFKILLILILITLSHFFYMRSLNQTQKPVFIAENLIGTIEKDAQVITKNGKFAIYGLTNVIYEPSEKKK